MKLIDFAIEQQVDLLLLAGDNWDGGHSDYGSLLFFAEEMTRLNRHGIRVVMIQGNHDAENQLRLTMPENVRMMPTRSPRSEVYGDLGIAVHGQSYPRRDVMENLAAKYPAAKSGMMNIGLFHTAVTGYAGAGEDRVYGRRSGLRRRPVIDAAQRAAHQLGAVAIGQPVSNAERLDPLFVGPPPGRSKLGVL